MNVLVMMSLLFFSKKYAFDKKGLSLIQNYVFNNFYNKEQKCRNNISGKQIYFCCEYFLTLSFFLMNIKWKDSFTLEYNELVADCFINVRKD